MFDVVVYALPAKTGVQPRGGCDEFCVFTHTLESDDIIASNMLIAYERNRDNFMGEFRHILAIVFMFGNLSFVLFFKLFPDFLDRYI